MIDPDLLFHRLDEAEDQRSVEQVLLSLLHASFEDDNIVFKFNLDSRVEYDRELVEPGRFSIEEYTTKKKNEDSYVIQAGFSYDDMVTDAADSADFHALLDGVVILNLTVEVGHTAIAGQAEVTVIPDGPSKEL